MRRRQFFFAAGVVGIAVVATLMLYFRLHEPANRNGGPEPAVIPLVFLGLALMAFMCKAVDSSLGMGYGTTLTPVLLAAGFYPHSVIPAALISQLLGGVCAGLLHHSYGNVDLRHNTPPSRVMYLLAGSGIVGGILATLLVVGLSPFYVKLYVGLLVVAIGVFVWFSPRLVVRLS